MSHIAPVTEAPEPAPNTSGRHAFPLLDAARGLAALTVVGFHCASAFRIPHLFEFSFLSVDFFFMLSGFVVGHAYAAKLEAGGYLGRFVTARLVRLYPMIVVGTLIGFALITIPHRPLLALGMGLGMIPRAVGPAGAFVFPLDPALWSLFFELLANLAFGLFAWRLRLRSLLVVCAVSLPLIVLGRSLHVGWETTSFLLGFPRTAFSFFAGLILHRLHRDGRLPDWSKAAPWLLAVLAAVLVSPLPLSHGRFPILLLEVAVLFPAVIVSLIAAEPGLRGLALCRLGGEASYPLYAIQEPIVIALAPGVLAAGAGLPAMAGLLLGLPALAWLIAKSVDAPIRAWLAHRIHRARSVPRLADEAV